MFAHLGSFSISIIALLIPLIQCWFHFYGPNEVWNGCVRCFDIVEVKDNLCCCMNATFWKQNGISLHRVCCLLDCDLLWYWINRWIRLWNEMIRWFCRLFLLSSDNLSVGEESYESVFPWIRDLISFVVNPISPTSSRVRVSQLQSSPLLFIPSHPNANHFHSISPNQSTKLILIHHCDSYSIEFSSSANSQPISSCIHFITVSFSLLCFSHSPT